MKKTFSETKGTSVDTAFTSDYLIDFFSQSQIHDRCRGKLRPGKLGLLIPDLPGNKDFSGFNFPGY